MSASGNQRIGMYDEEVSTESGWSRVLKGLSRHVEKGKRELALAG